MSTPEYEWKKPRLPLAGEVAFVALAFALIVTTCGWLWVGKTSPFNHGIAPDVHTSPEVMSWVAATFPAAMLFISLFGKLGAEWQYFLCVFIQWLVVGIAVGGLFAAVHRARGYV